MNFDSNEEIIKSISKIIEGLDFTIHEYGESIDEYSYLQENELCITIKNSSGEDAIYIDLADELTLTIGAWHAHYDYSDEDYNEMIEALKDYLECRICVLEIYYLKSGELKWFGSNSMTVEEFNLLPAKELIKRYVDKRIWPINGKAVFRFFDEGKTITQDFSLGNI